MSTDVSEEHITPIFRAEKRSWARNQYESFLRPWRWGWYVPPKHQLTLNGLHGVISQKMVLFITTAVKTSNPTEWISVYGFILYYSKARWNFNGRLLEINTQPRYTCCVLIAWVTLRPWRWRQYVPPKVSEFIPDYTASYPRMNYCNKLSFWITCNAGFEGLPVVAVKSTVCWLVPPCGSERAYKFHLRCRKVKEARNQPIPQKTVPFPSSNGN
jgi:hypothetical protein